MTSMLRVPRLTALLAIAVLILASAAVSFAESYRGLFLWAEHHGLSGTWAAIWPLQVDVFIAVGELALFVGLADRWPPRSRIAAWVVTGIGLVVSVAGNVGHVASHALTNRATASVPPLAAAAALAVGLGVLKRVVAYSTAPVSIWGQPGLYPAAPAAETGPPEDDADLGEYGDETGIAADDEFTQLGDALLGNPANGYDPPEHGQEAAELFAADLVDGLVPSVRAIRSQFHIGHAKGVAVRDYLALLVPENDQK